MIQLAAQINPELFEQIMYVVMAAVGWFAKWLQSKGKHKELEEKRKELETKNEKLSTVILQYDQAARNALKHSRMAPRPLESPGSVGDESNKD